LIVQELSIHDWQRYRDIRIASLKSDPDAFGGDAQKATAESESEWQSKFEKVIPIVAVIEDKDCALLTIENLTGDFGATCWIGGCWVDPSVRGWKYNQSAIDVYLALGFENKGEPVPSTSKPGLFYQRMIRQVN